MKSIDDFLMKLFGRNIHLRLGLEDKLQCDAPKGMLPESIINELKSKKTSLIGVYKNYKTKELYPLSSVQRSLWFLSELNMKNGEYNVTSLIKIKGNFNMNLMNEAFQVLCKRHAILRSFFLTLNGTPFSTTNRHLITNIKVLDAQGKNKTQLEEFILSLQEKTFNLCLDPLVEMFLIHCGKQEAILMLILPHIISDAWSINILMHDFSVIYNAFHENQNISLKEIKGSYFDFAKEQATLDYDQKISSSVNYWVNHLKNFPPLLDFPLNNPRPALQTSTGKSLNFTFSKEYLAAFKGICADNDLTLFMGLIALFSILLNRYTGQSDIVIGTPVANRTRLEYEEVVGCFINNIAFGFSLDSQKSLREYFQSVRKMILSGFEHLSAPFESVVKALNVERSLAFSPIFQVLFVLKNAPIEPIHLVNMKTEALYLPSRTSKYDLTLTVEESDEQLMAQLIYCDDLFEPDVILGFSKAFQNLIHEVVEDSNRKICEYRLLNEQDAQSLMALNHRELRSPEHNICIHTLIERQVLKTPLNIALKFDDECLTYVEFNAKANALAYLLMEYGIKSGDFVPVMMELGLEIPLAYFAIMKIGAVFVPISPDWPTTRQQLILEDIAASIILSTRIELNLPNAKCRNITVDYSEIKGINQNPELHVDIDAPIYAIYTSGSTGAPRAAINKHRGITNRFLYMNGVFGIGESDTILQTTDPIFDSVVWQFFWPLINGARCVLLRKADKLDIDVVVEIINFNKITYADFVPSYFESLVDALDTKLNLFQKLTSLRRLIIGGEAIVPSIIKKFNTFLPHVRISNAYGPTETSIGVIFYDIPLNTPDKIPIGKPIDNVYSLILDENLNPCPQGVRGELFLSGACLGLGYLNNKVETEKAFIRNPHSQIRSEYLYKTGDRVRYAENGNIEFLGRLDNQIKFRGYRINLDEIKKVLNTFPGIRNSEIIFDNNVVGSECLLAFCVSKIEQLNSEYLRQYLSERLPRYMIPARYIMLNKIPLAESGKPSRSALLKLNVAPDIPLQEINEEGEFEHSVGAIWAKYLNLEKVDIAKNFFDLGGHSLMLLKIYRDLMSHYENTNLKITDLFRYPTVRLLSNYIKENMESNTCKLT